MDAFGGMKRFFQLILSLTLVCTLTAYLLMGRGQVQLVQRPEATSSEESAAAVGGPAAHPSLVGLQGSVSGLGERVERFREAWHRVYAVFTPKPKKRSGGFRAAPASNPNGINLRGSMGIGLTFIFIALAVAGLTGAIGWLERRARA
jgi:hypothetical protein